MNHKLDAKTAFFDTLPTVFGYIGIGIAFGIVGKAAGLSPFLVLLSSLITYAGSAQFILVSMLAVNSPILSIIFAVFLVNSRFILMGLTIAPYFKMESTHRNFILGLLLTDESFALGMNKLNYTDNKLSFAWLNTANIMAYIVWALATLGGALLGTLVTNPQQLGLDFALIAMFIGLLYLQLISDKSIHFNLQLIVIAVVFILTFIGLIFIPSNLLILIVTLVGCGIGVTIKHAFF
ncbi:AzlC family ABC transporter permease [Weissella diestrammenae]|uniref:AzlC family ABC transporter permease n=1 Tax=Weissella diestrammenae TaxID=1162633 RepID=A0A7G9T560_9LACO|nr:AzlC family ABC transporter permease [Weissella diestrammenae]MCM0583091.1 AzlC family ABC transporter permease [Weissella diestrammenae]QNN75235.1 AzlC family ABC transporter permease [Weissella diestrammenae]